MIIRRVTRAQLDAAAGSAGVELVPSGNPERFTLAPFDELFRRRAPDSWRRLPNVCFHGHLVFFRKLYALAPDALIISGKARFESLADLEAKKDEVADSNIGSLMNPWRYGSACECASDPLALAMLVASDKQVREAA